MKMKKGCIVVVLLGITATSCHSTKTAQVAEAPQPEMVQIVVDGVMRKASRTHSRGFIVYTDVETGKELRKEPTRIR